jgi:hypothetical protein
MNLILQNLESIFQRIKISTTNGKLHIKKSNVLTKNDYPTF